jgi:putative ABC transport system permease protein
MIFLVAGLMTGVAAITALLSITQILEKDISVKMEEYGANILITPETEGLSLSYGGLSLGGVSFDLKEIDQKDVAKIREIENAENISIVSPKVFGVFEHQGRKALVVGVDFSSELELKKWWQLKGNPPSSENQILAGTEAAQKFNLLEGGQIEIQGKNFEVSGIIDQTGSQDDGLFFMSLSVAQQLFDKKGVVAMIEVAALCRNCPISEIVAQISQKLPEARVTAIQQVVKSRMKTLHSFRKFSMAISAMVLVVGAMVVFVTMMGSVNERTREIGIFSAIGFRRSHIMKIILTEAFIVSLAAGLIGYGAGMGITRLLAEFFADKATVFAPDPAIAAVAVILAVATGLTASFYPAAAASRMDPSEALRTL